jgi:hypothetical protein
LRREFLDPFFKALGGPPHSHTFIWQNHAPTPNWCHR